MHAGILYISVEYMHYFTIIRGSSMDSIVKKKRILEVLDIGKYALGG